MLSRKILRLQLNKFQDFFEQLGGKGVGNYLIPPCIRAYILSIKVVYDSIMFKNTTDFVHITIIHFKSIFLFRLYLQINHNFNKNCNETTVWVPGKFWVWIRGILKVIQLILAFLLRPSKRGSDSLTPLIYVCGNTISF